MILGFAGFWHWLGFAIIALILASGIEDGLKGAAKRYVNWKKWEKTGVDYAD